MSWLRKWRMLTPTNGSAERSDRRGQPNRYYQNITHKHRARYGYQQSNWIQCLLFSFPKFRFLRWKRLFYFKHHKQWLQLRPHPQDEILVTSLHDLLYFMWLLTSCPEAMADIRDSSPAKTAPATMVAKSLEFDPGSSLLAPFTPSMFKQADWDASCVPPPTVPTWEVKKTYKT